MSKKPLFLIVPLLLMSLIFGASYAQNVNQKTTKNNYGKVFTKKTGDQGYTLYYLDKSGREKLKIEYPQEPVITKYNNNIVEVTISMGNPNSYSLYIDMKNEAVSPTSFEAVIARDTKNKIVATAEVDSINIYNMFGTKKVIKKVKRNFSLVAALITAIQKAEFLDGRKLHIVYQCGPNFEEKEEIIKL